jgi:KaiC/GvpD/RAD55 family RecA-like ATPase
MSQRNGNGVLPEFNILDHLESLTVIKELGSEYHCSCPACGDGGFKIDKASGKYAAFKCECSNAAIREAIRPLSQAFEEYAPAKPVRPEQVRKWEYRDRNGKPLVAVKRIDNGDGTKQITQGHWDGTKYANGCPPEIRSQIPVYRYADVRAAIGSGKATVLWVEGEPCADALWSLGIPATTSIGGSSGLRRYGDYSADLAGANVVVCPDMDKTGMAYAEAVAEMYPTAQWCYAFPDSPWWERLPGNGGLDIADWIDKGATAEQVLSAVGPRRKPKGEPTIDLDQQAADLEAIVNQYANEQSPVRRALLKARILADFRIGRTELAELESEFKAPPPLSFHHISAPSIEYGCDYLQVLEQKASGEIAPGLSTGFRDLDGKLMGMKPHRLYFIAGRPSMGKSALAENIILNAANQGASVLTFTMEMPIDEWKDRATAIYTGIDTNRIASGRIEENEWPLVTEAIAQYNELPIFMDQSPGVTVDQMRRTVDALSKSCGAPQMIVVDYLSLVRASAPNQNRVQEVSAIARDLQVFAKEVACPVVIVSQLSRDLAGRADKRPVLTDLRESGEIEQVADVVLMIHREEEYDENTEDKGIAEILIRKNRQGAKGTVRLLYESHCVRFKDLPSY